MAKAIELKTAIPGPRSKELLAQRAQHVSKAQSAVTPLFVARAQGAVLEDVDGNHLLDFGSGIGVVNVGHAAAPLVEAVREQVGRFTHTCFSIAGYTGYLELCAQLNARTPGNFAKKSFLANSGAEGVENAVKIARAYTGRQAVICFEHAFHGRTYLGMTLTGKHKPYKHGFAPFLPEVYRAPAPYPYRWPGGGSDAEVTEQCFARFADMVNSHIGPERVAAVILEPVLGEGGFIPVPATFMQKLRRYCDDHKIVLIADEVQSGFGRTGTLFACEQLGVVPDLIVTAKGLGGGMPIAAVTGRAEMMDAPMEGALGGTYGGNPVSCAAALAVLKLFEDGKLLERSKKLGEKLTARLTRWHEKFPLVGDVRGLGAMRGLELVKDRGTREPNPEACKALVKYCIEHGVLILSAGTYGNVVRLLMPLVIEDAQLDEGLAVIEAGLTQLQGASK